MKEFKDIFKELRESRHCTQIDLANRLGVARSTIGMYETGKRKPDYEGLVKIADFFNVSMDYLFGR